MPEEGTTGGPMMMTTTTMTPSTSTTTPMATTMVEEMTGSSTSEMNSSSSEGSGGSSSSTGASGLPDIDMSQVVKHMTASVYTTTETFSKSSCPLSEACIEASGERRLLNFSTITPNVGDADFVVGSPLDKANDNFEWGECHGHWHFSNFADYQLLDEENNVVATGHKQAFALIDLAPFWDDPGPGQYPLQDGTQGISVGWADIYSAGLDCQWIDITGVPSGDYFLEVHINFMENVEESDYSNNIALIPVTITDEDTGMPEAPKDWTCNPSYYAAFDGCDCGCGVFDPDCMNPTAAACEYCDNEGACSEGLGCDAITNNNNAVCD